MLVEVRVRTASEDDAILIPNGSSLPVKGKLRWCRGRESGKLQETRRWDGANNVDAGGWSMTRIISSQGSGVQQSHFYWLNQHVEASSLASVSGN
jgi:hypothetical protein